jgi:hypothetical protein
VKKAIRVLSLDHAAIMEVATKCDRQEYEYEEDDEDKSNEDSEESKGSELESEY